jgi:hypothetical protein
VGELNIVIELGWSAVPKEFVARMVKVYVPTVVGVPVTDPVEFNVRPGGRLPLKREYVMVAEPLAEKLCE